MNINKLLMLLILFNIALFIQPHYIINSECKFTKYVKIIEKYCDIENIETERVIALVMTESSMREKVTKYESTVGEEAIGGGQLLLSTAKLYDENVTKKQLLNFDKNMQITIKHLAMLNKKHSGDFEKITREYNGGPRKKNNRGYYLKVKSYYDAIIVASDNRGLICLK